MRQHSLESAVRAAGIDVPPVFSEETASTSTDARELAEAGAPEWTVVATNHQTGGRGRLGRSWVSVPGKLLQFSVVLRPALPPQRISLLSYLAATEVIEASSATCGVEVRAKWPNDVVASERKLAGILPEALIEEGKVGFVILGIGINLSMGEEDFPGEIRGLATSLAMEGAPTIDDAAILQEILRGLADAYKPWSEAFPDAVLRAYALHCVTLGRRVKARTTAGDLVEGTAERLGANGELVLVDGASELLVAFGEVEHLE
ncbi:MAG TPA: biotin--[acetyl-CoA-carboxylase] ligase [Actinomycetota bacterium]|nr:biotin--[acetyl-CoA-carboxylase] ligase [Actinomycetota bacterium]